MGLVEINGLATGPYTMPAPITAVPCYYYRTMAWRWERRGKSSEWVKVADESLHVPFYLDDNTGRVPVDPTLRIANIVKGGNIAVSQQAPAHPTNIRS